MIGLLTPDGHVDSRREARVDLRWLAPLLLAAPLVLLGSPPSGFTAEIDLDAILPPLVPWTGTSEQLMVGADSPWVTPGELTGLTASPSYDETMAWISELVDAAPQLEMISLGKSYQGRDMWMVIASKGGASTPDELRANGRPTVLAQAGIHSGEIDGKDAGMMLLRDMTVGETKSDLLDGANFLFVPIFSVDAHERSSTTHRINQRGPEKQGWRSNARNQNLNRDYAKADTPEMRAMLAAIDAWQPDLYLDLHVTDGVDYQYDITFGYNGPHCWSPAIGRWLDSVLRPAVTNGLSEMGHIPGPLIFAVDNTDMSKGIWGWTAGPRFSTGYADVRHLPCVLLENHSLKPFRQRVLGTYVFVEECLRIVAEETATLRTAVEADRARREENLPLTWAEGEGEPPMVELLAIESKMVESPITGDSIVSWLGEPETLTVPHRITSVGAARVRRPAAYWVPAAWPDVIDRLELHGIQLERIGESTEVEVEIYRLSEVELGESAYEGHVRVSATPTPETMTWTYQPGAARVSTDQPLGDLAMLLLEPASSDSFFQWGFFVEVLSRVEYFEVYAMEPLARKMLEEDPGLGERFDAALAADQELAASPRGRLEWFYEQSPFYDQRYLLYPVGREG